MERLRRLDWGFILLSCPKIEVARVKLQLDYYRENTLKLLIAFQNPIVQKRHSMPMTAVWKSPHNSNDNRKFKQFNKIIYKSATVDSLYLLFATGETKNRNRHATANMLRFGVQSRRKFLISLFVCIIWMIRNGPSRHKNREMRSKMSTSKTMALNKLLLCPVKDAQQ